MAVSSVSNLSVQAALTSALQTEQSTLTQLTAQLSSQKQHANLTDYSASDARNLVNLQSTATQRQAYLSVINTVSNNLSVYDTTLTDLESVVTQAKNLADNNPNYSADTASNIAIQATNYLRSVTADLNQQVNGRYIYAGTRYTTAPAQNLADLNATTNPLPSSANNYVTDTSTNVLPSYDASYTGAGSTSAAAYTTDRATIDTGDTISYGITSNDPAIQQLVAGIRYLQAAGNATDSATYQTDMSNAASALAYAMTNLQAVHTTVANNINLMTTEKATQNTAISNLTDQVSNIQQVDVTQVSTEITSLETILQASYSVTGSILKMSIVSYL